MTKQSFNFCVSSVSWTRQWSSLENEKDLCKISHFIMNKSIIYTQLFECKLRGFNLDSQI